MSDHNTEVLVRRLAMLSTKRARGLERAISSCTSFSVPSFLLPAFQIVPARTFCITSARKSHIGKAPLSIPPEVNFIVTEPQVVRNGRRGTVSTQPTVSIEGPLGTGLAVMFHLLFIDFDTGKLTMTIPPFIKLEHDTAAGKAVVTVEDKDIRNQREMWGTHSSKSTS